MIEILPDVFYDPSLPWYAQDEQLIELAETVMQGMPINSDMQECRGGSLRLVWGEWEHTTECGTFTMRVDKHYSYAPENRAFLSLSAHDSVTITKQ